VIMMNKPHIRFSDDQNGRLPERAWRGMRTQSATW
jgi:hypothetical protein